MMATILVEKLGRKFHGTVDSDEQLLRDDETAWPADCGAADDIRHARAAYEAGDMDAAAEAVLCAQAAVEQR